MNPAAAAVEVLMKSALLVGEEPLSGGGGVTTR